MHGANDARTDQAALFGAALAAVIATAVGDELWDGFDVVLGLVPLLILAGYYRPVRPKRGWDTLSKGAAFAGVCAFSLSIMAGLPIQSLLAGTRRYYNDCSANRQEFEQFSACFADAANSFIPFIWAGLFLATFAVWCKVLLPRFSHDSEQEAEQEDGWHIVYSNGETASLVRVPSNEVARGVSRSQSRVV